MTAVSEHTLSESAPYVVSVHDFARDAPSAFQARR